MAIEKVVFITPWQASGYEHEITENQLARYQALTLEEQVLGYLGYWLIGDEAHVSTIAVHPNWRGRGLGELLLLNSLFLAHAEGATLVTLEVRRSNIAAQNLYLKYGFVVAGERRRYYPPKGPFGSREDALIMTLEKLDTPHLLSLEQRWADLCRRLEIGEWRLAANPPSPISNCQSLPLKETP